jgi:glycosyltransferase involved in cell wall biosynthesis
VQASEGAVENWPRVGLEAMAAGVPVVVDNRGGWPEMIRHGQTGFLCNDEGEMASCIARLAHDSTCRRAIIAQARRAVETELSDPETWWRQWKDLLL